MKNLSRCVLFFSLVITGMPLKAMDFYVAKNGMDTNPGSIERPFATLQKARDAVRSLRKSNQVNGPLTIYIREGIYNLNETFVLKPEDSGTEDSPLIIRGFEDEKVVISGGKSLDLMWKKWKGDIWKATIPEIKKAKTPWKEYKEKRLPNSPDRWHFRQL